MARSRTLDDALGIDAAAFDALDERLSSQWMRGFRGPPLSTAEFLRSPISPRAEARTGTEFRPDEIAPSGLELDEERLKK